MLESKLGHRKKVYKMTKLRSSAVLVQSNQHRSNMTG